jgi:molybdopterin-guanine dinucleotide biosynthesis protein A
MRSWETDITGVLLAGGKSRRMGKDKRNLILQGETLFQRALDVLVETFKEVIVVLGVDDFPVKYDNVRVVNDLIPNRAAAGGLFTGLYYSKTPRVFAVACDMPFLNQDVIRFMVSQSLDADITLAELAHGLQTMHAVYSKSCEPHLKLMVKSENLRIQSLLDVSSLHIRKISESELVSIDKHLSSFMNLNSPADYEMARKMNPSNSIK